MNPEAARPVLLRAAAAAAALAAITACAVPPRRAVRRPPIPRETSAKHEELAAPGVVHVVRRGETLYRIAKAYGMKASDLMETNGISDPRTVAVGTELFLPGVSRTVEVPPAPAPERAHAGGAPAPAAPAPAAAAKPVLGWPLRGVLYGRFGVRGGARHDGIDLAAPEGTPVLAAAEGTAIYVGEQTGFGKVVILRHDGGLVTVYAHNSAVLVREGARVARGQPIARVGQTGRTSGPHLHFEVREGTRPRNPLLYVE
jgi:murein DD-endopeptidase MepM/ murein hydrolase activator NlpD